MQQIYLWIKKSSYYFSGMAALTLSVFLNVSAFAQAPEIKLEAENATLNGVSIANSPEGFSGTGFAWNFDNSADNITFDFNATAGEYDLSIIYYSPYGEKGYGLDVNGVSADKMFSGTGSGFGSVSAGKFTLKNGSNTIKITNGWGYYGIDYIKLVPAGEKPKTIVPLVDGKAEAELADRNGTDVSADPKGYSGTGYVTSFDAATDQVSISFKAPAGLYDLQIGYTSPYGEKGFDFVVNTESGSGMFTPETGFKAVGVGKFLLNEGVNTVTITRGWGYFGIDYIKITPSVPPVPLKPSKQLTNANATQSTRALFSYMTDLYGSKTLSGQYDDVDYVLEKTGKESAIGGFDLIEYSPSRVENGSRPAGTSERYINWAKKGEGKGILSLAWHWNAPTDLINQAPDKLWWSGFYTNATTFDIAAALADKNSERYKLLIRDMDVIAAELKKFQDADVPVLWRPLHEAAGGWFWWGAKGPEPLKELWRIMYNRFTNHHHLNNLIWVYTFTGSADMNWYPGDAYVDMAGIDIYSNDPYASLSGDWENLLNKFNGKKLISLSESGTLPVMNKVRAYGTWWSWFAIWNGDYIKKQPVDVLRAVYHDEDVITRDELPNWRMYGRPTVSVTAPANNAQFLVCETPVLTAQAADKEGKVEQVAFWANGNLLGTDTTPGDGWKLDWKNAPVGTYQIIAEATDNEGNSTPSAPVTITIKPDVVAPVITLKAPKTIIPAEDHLLKTISLSSFIASVTDNCGPAPIVRIQSVSSDEAVTGGGSGNTKTDIIISPDGQSVQVRAERAGTGDGRVYVITVEAIDQAGNIGLATYQVQVPKSASKAAIAGAPVYTVKGNYAKTIASRKETAASLPVTVTPAVKVYPNPAKGNYLTVELFAPEKQEVNLTLRNANSQSAVNSRHQVQAGVNQIQLPLTHVSAGLYILQIQNGQEVISRKVVVSKQ
ncbi:glycosyl hydrolase [Adhaeribacter pallidiroseus]|uniref:Mannan endo-1,4-beta-mannosidase n=1 Tax=Adhaeribacter pallidiroseus TaxID=2072847 RepID=A0A369QE41_9BACT|nr:glycosyl hydrolase [Adhaeribacter pallidiroseus]RDC61476.1 Mannan endo-1,4-beta-mannosidase [Adhaeribacter pallidiroseus]